MVSMIGALSYVEVKNFEDMIDIVEQSIIATLYRGYLLHRVARQILTSVLQVEYIAVS